jgi:sialic acid synthase SpsE
MPYEWVPVLKAVAEGLGLFFFTSVYDTEAVDIAESYGIASYKIASFEINHEALLERVARTGKKVYLSCGCANLPELYKATRIIMKHHRYFVLLHCVSHYPARPEEMNLRTIYELGRYCRGQAGLSDHSEGITIPSVAASMGIVALEKHIRIGESPDFWALEPHEFADMVKAVRVAEESQGSIKMGGSSQYKRQMVEGKLVRCTTGA